MGKKKRKKDRQKKKKKERQKKKTIEKGSMRTVVDHNCDLFNVLVMASLMQFCD